MGNVLTIRFERFTVFKPPALPEVMTQKSLPSFTFGKSDDRRGLGGLLRPGVKDVARRNHEAASIPWPGRATTIADCGLRNAD